MCYCPGQAVTAVSDSGCTADGGHLECVHPARDILQSALQQSDSIGVLVTNQVYLSKPQLGQRQAAVQRVGLQERSTWQHTSQCNVVGSAALCISVRRKQAETLQQTGVTVWDVLAACLRVVVDSILYLAICVTGPC